MDYIEDWRIWTIWWSWSIRTQGLRNNHDPFDCENMSVRMCVCVRRAFSWSHVSFLTLFQPEFVGERAVSRGSAQLAAQPAAHIAVQPAAQLAVQSTTMRRVRCSKKKEKKHAVKIPEIPVYFS